VGPEAGDAVGGAAGSAPGAILAALGQAVIATDLLGRIQYWNRAAEDLYGYTEGEAIGRLLSELIIVPGDEPLLSEWVARLLAGESFAGDWRVRNKAGTTFTAYVTLTPVLDDDDTVVANVGVSHGASREREAEAAARRVAAIVDSIRGDGVVASEDLPNWLAAVALQLSELSRGIHAVTPSSDWSAAPPLRGVPGVTQLSARELDIVRRLLAGDRVPAIAQAVFLSQSTVRNHLARVYRKLGVGSQQELINLLRHTDDAQDQDEQQQAGSMQPGRRRP
jgi:PAS domain S-box-containing protein